MAKSPNLPPPCVPDPKWVEAGKPYRWKPGQTGNPRGSLYPKDTRELMALAQRERAALMNGAAQLPLAFLFDVYNNPEYPLKVRVQAAIAAAPYVHKRMPIEIYSAIGQPVAKIEVEDLAKLSDRELDLLEKLIRKTKPDVQ